jgi:hypothetical protein
MENHKTQNLRLIDFHKILEKQNWLKASGARLK